jgi:ATP-binding cassette subfamily B protein
MAVARRPGMEAEAVLGKAMDMRLVRRVSKYVRPHFYLLLGWVGFMLLTIALELAQPYIFARSITHILEGDIDALTYDALAFIGLVVAQNISSYIEQTVLQLAGQRTMHDMRIAIFDHVLAQRAAFFDKIPVGRLMTRMTNDIESLNEMFAQGAITIIADAVKAVAIIVIMLTKDVALTAMVMTTLPFLIILVEYARRAMRISFRQIRVRIAAMNGFAQEHLFGIRVVQMLGRAKIAQREYDEINAGHRDAYLLQIRADAVMYAMVEAIGYVAIALIAFWASGHHQADIATIAMIVVFIELWAIAYIQKRFMETPFWRAVLQVVLGGSLVFGAGILIGSA